MEAPYWARTSGDSILQDGPGRGHSCRHGRAGNEVLQPTSNGNYSVSSEPYAKPVQTKQLNPHAKAWSPVMDGAPEEDRCLFVTFSNGRPITETEITRFFTLHYGDCLERVYVHRPQPKDYRDYATPQFGKVIFKESVIPLTMTNCGKKQSKFMVDGKPLWCKKFDPNKTQSSRKNQIS
ncbi:hypothetical protein PTKIN_Ptkin12aG0205400 [Pterospermum kingtungense]